MERFFGFLFVAVLIYYGFKLMFRYAVPWMIARFMKKQQDKFNRMNGFDNAGNSSNNEGDVHIKTRQAQKPKKDTDFGEYVDFEEIDE